MRKIISIALALLFVGCTTPNNTKEMKTTESKPQTVQASLQNRLETYFKYSRELNTNGLLDMTYYRVYDVMSKSKMKDTFDQAFNNPNAPTLKKADYEKNVKIKKYANGFYAIVPWDAYMTMPTRTTDAKKEKFLADMMGMMMKNTTVNLESKAHILHIQTKDKKMLAIKENGRAWEFVDDQMAKQFKIVPKEIADKL